jgi:hypothetical protein
MKYKSIREEELKNRVAADYFWLYDCKSIIGNVDFWVRMHQTAPSLFERESLLWAEAKQGKSDVYASLAQLVLTIGKARTFDKHLPPAFLGGFDGERIAFVPYAEVSEIFYINDFNWNVTPSDYSTREFGLVLDKVKAILQSEALIYRFGEDDKELNAFIKENFLESKRGVQKTRIDKSNFMVIYNKWLAEVKPSISVDWEAEKTTGIIDGDFYLADLLSDNIETLGESLFVLLKDNEYELDREILASGRMQFSKITFKDQQKAHTHFWNRYHRPPREEYWAYIKDRRDLLVPQDVRERKGSFFTPLKWVALSQQYITDLLGPDWQDEYYVWDCAAGTGNLLAGLTNKYNIWASTLDKADVEVMRDRIKNGANLLASHVFQFDFLNDDFTKLPEELQKIINDPEKRKKLVVYINPPYAEVASKAEKGKVGVNLTTTHKRFQSILGTAGRELFTQFLTRILIDLNGSIVAEFSKLKLLQGSAFLKLRKAFQPSLIRMFIVPANTFDNVKGQFPIGFKIWDTKIIEAFSSIVADVFDEKGVLLMKKTISTQTKSQYINSWISLSKSHEENAIGYMDGINGNDFQHNNIVYLLNAKSKLPNPRGIWINRKNIYPICIYLAVRHCIEATWLNDRDQFLYPNDSWKTDEEFQTDCLAFTLFNGQNKISATEGLNHWIPFTETQVNAREKFSSNFMSRYLAGKASKEQSGQIKIIMEEMPIGIGQRPVVFSALAQAVYNAGLELWRYYHAQPGVDVNASLYDIRAHFQGRNEGGKMNNKSTDEVYNAHIGALRQALKLLAAKLEPKVYEHGFLKA